MAVADTPEEVFIRTLPVVLYIGYLGYCAYQIWFINWMRKKWEDKLDEPLGDVKRNDISELRDKLGAQRSELRDELMAQRDEQHDKLWAQGDELRGEIRAQRDELWVQRNELRDELRSDIGRVVNERLVELLVALQVRCWKDDSFAALHPD